MLDFGRYIKLFNQLIRNINQLQTIISALIHHSKTMSSNKKFPKKKVVKFRLVSRSQKDPLAADDDAPQNVLVPTEGDEDFIQSLNLASDVFPSEREEKVGMLERAHNADGITLDEDIVAAMGPDFKYDLEENIIDDDFFLQAGGLIEGEDDGELVGDELSELSKQLFDSEAEIIQFGPSHGKCKNSSNNADEDDDDDYEDDEDSDDYNVDVDDGNSSPDWMDDAPNNCDDLGRRLISFKQGQQNNKQRKSDDSKSVFTEYSMTSSILRANNEGLQRVDDHFEKLYERHYADDSEIGPGESDVQGGFRLKDPKEIKGLINEVKRVRKKNHGDDYKPEIVSEHHKLAIIGEDLDEEEDLVETEVRRRENRVDCESILSYNSTLFNHPRLIVEPKRRKRKDCASISSTDQEMKSVEDDDDVQSKTDRQSIASSRMSILSKLSVRPNNETPEEKRARKRALQEFRHERRQERKTNQRIFKLEERNVLNQQNKVPAMRLA